ncbi:bifunctional DNA primase/polymerase [Streptomyces marincola]|uniref:bifunctional DNA primase/polymerase n=1 Tax=Streptomyces marincola TaxID=2878388 RepID=UPI001CF0FF7A|nr:bifunctional DNA primase/polymerase [Streptomyces marincola]UCM89177.1 bifunctional DNA primase/polymerase [Streptomyces marincola]
MREILGERRTNGNGKGHGHGLALRGAALVYARQWGWPVLPGVGTDADGTCGCPRANCVVPGAHPVDPGLLAATTDARMVQWWWTARPSAPIVLATGGRAPCALSLPAVAAAGALAELERRAVPTGPVVAAPTRWMLLVEPYGLPELGELLGALDRVPSSLRFHGPGGYVPLPPSRTGSGGVGWAREPEPTEGRVPLPRAADLIDALVEAGLNAPEPGGWLAL